MALNNHIAFSHNSVGHKCGISSAGGSAGLLWINSHGCYHLANRVGLEEPNAGDAGCWLGLLSSGLLVYRDDGCFRAASRMTSQTALPGTVLVLAMKVPYHRKLPGESGWLVILAVWRKRVGVTRFLRSKLRTSTVRLLLHFVKHVPRLGQIQEVEK